MWEKVYIFTEATRTIEMILLQTTPEIYTSDIVYYVIGIIVSIVVIILLFLAFRWLNLWYYKINERVAYQEQIAYDTHKMLEEVKEIKAMIKTSLPKSNNDQSLK